MYYGMHDDKNALKYMLEAADKGMKRDNEYLENLGIAYLNLKMLRRVRDYERISEPQAK
jgi:dsRNA-specific ribonuclease